MTVEARLNANRKRRLLQALDKALAKHGVKPPRRPAKPAASTVTARLEARHRLHASRRDYEQLRAAILTMGGIRPNPDYKRTQIPRDLYRPKGLAMDEMAQVLSAFGYHYEGDVDLFEDIGRSKESIRSARSAHGRRHKNPSIVCTDNCRDAHGRFQVCPHGA